MPLTGELRRFIYRTFVGSSFLIPIILLIVFLVVVVWVVSDSLDRVFEHLPPSCWCVLRILWSLCDVVPCWRKYVVGDWFWSIIDYSPLPVCYLCFLSVENMLSFCFLTTMVVLSCCFKDFPLWWTVAPMELPVKIKPFSFNLLFCQDNMPQPTEEQPPWLVLLLFIPG